MTADKSREFETEQLWLRKAGRGLYCHGDGVIVDATTPTKMPWLSGESFNTGNGTIATHCTSAQIFTVASSMGWLKVTWMSGSAGGVSHGWIPIFSGNVI